MFPKANIARPMPLRTVKALCQCLGNQGNYIYQLSSKLTDQLSSCIRVSLESTADQYQYQSVLIFQSVQDLIMMALKQTNKQTNNQTNKQSIKNYLDTD